MDPEETKRNLIAQFAEFGASSAVEHDKETSINKSIDSGKKAKRNRKSKKKAENVLDNLLGDTPCSSGKEKTGNKISAVTKRKDRPPPEVIIFEEPGKTKSEDNVQESGEYRKKKAKMSEQEDDDDDEFRAIAEEVKEFGMTGFSQKEQKKYEQRKAQMLGAKAPKGRKMPYKIVMYAAKVRKQREVEETKQKREMGIMVKRKSETKPLKTGPHGWWSDKSKGVNPSVGKFKGGTYHIEKPVKLKRKK